MKKINLLKVINSNLDTDIIKDIIYNEAESEGVEVFSEYVKSVEVEDIKEDIKLYATKQLEELAEDTTDELIEVYIEGMGNNEILKALR